MRKILLILLLAVGFVADAQVKQKLGTYGVRSNRIQPDSALRLPTVIVGIKDQNLGLDTGQVYYNKVDSTVLVWTGSQWKLLGGGGSGSGWALTGNASTDTSINFLGTTDAAGLNFRVNNKRAGYISNSNDGVVTQAGDVYLGQYAGNHSFKNRRYGNTLIGQGAGYYIGEDYGHTGYIQSDQSTMVGNWAGFFTQTSQSATGGRNAFFGQSSGFRNITGSDNTFLGTFAGEVNNNGSGNTFVSRDAGRSNTDGFGNVAVGGLGLLNTSTGVSGYTIITPGTGYSGTPSVTFSSPYITDHGLNMTATQSGASSSGGGVVAGSMTNFGSEYHSASPRNYFYPGFPVDSCIVTISGTGTGATARPIFRSGEYNTAIGGNTGMDNITGRFGSFLGYGSGSYSTHYRYLDSMNTFLGAYATIATSVPAMTGVYHATAVGAGSTVSQSNTVILGRVGTDRVGIGTLTPQSDLHVEGEFRYITGNQGIYKTLLSDNNGVGDWVNIGLGNGVANRVTKWTSSTALSTSLITDDGTYVGVDDITRGTTTTNPFVFFARNSYPGDGSGVPLPFVLFRSQSTSGLQKYMLEMSALNMPTSSYVSYVLGKDYGAKNIYLGTFFYAGNGSNSNYFEEQFVGQANLRRLYSNGNMTIGSSVTTDNGYKLEVGGKIKGDDSLWSTSGVRFSGLPTTAQARVVMINGTTGNLYSVDTTGLFAGGGGGGPFYDSTLMASTKRLKDTAAAIRLSIPTNVVSRADIYPIATFGGGGGNAGDTTSFTTSTIYGSFYTGEGLDTLSITGMNIGLQGTSPNVTVTVYWNDSLNVTAGAVKLVNAGSAATNIYTGTSVTTFDNWKIPPGVWVWVKTTVVATKPTYLTVTLQGFREGRISP